MGKTDLLPEILTFIGIGLGIGSACYFAFKLINNYLTNNNNFTEVVFDTTNNPVTYNEVISIIPTTLEMHVNTMNFLTTFFINGNNLNYVFGSIFILFKIVSNYKLNRNHFNEEFFFEIYMDSVRLFKKSLFKQLNEQFYIAGFINPYFEREIFIKKMQNFVFHYVTSVFNTLLFLKDGFDIVVIKKSNNLSNSLTSNEILDLIKYINYNVFIKPEDYNAKLALLNYTLDWAIVSITNNHYYDFQNVDQAITKLLSLRNLSLRCEYVVAYTHTQKNIDELGEQCLKNLIDEFLFAHGLL